jgi:hypothetical protein
MFGLYPPVGSKHYTCECFLEERGKYRDVCAKMEVTQMYEDVWGSGGIAHHIPNLGARWR